MNFDTLKEELSEAKVRLVAVSKTHHPKEIKKIYNKGHLDFGENKVQELLPKEDLLPNDIRWHFVGHLQSNKVRQIVPFIHLIHSLDRMSLAREIQKQGKRNQRKISTLLQIKIADEDSKHGLEPDKVDEFMDQLIDRNYDHIRIKGVMGMATLTEDEEQIKNEFQILDDTFHHLKEKYFADRDEFEIKSYGMTADYKLAIEKGSNMVRLGTLVFGERN